MTTSHPSADRPTSWRRALAVACLLFTTPASLGSAQRPTRLPLQALSPLCAARGVDEGAPEQDPAARLTELERQLGWRDLLADGLDGWLGTRADAGELRIGPGWSYADGGLHLEAGAQGGDLVSRESFVDFELSFEWCVSPGANSGVKVRVPYDTPGQPRVGPEYQVLDDQRHPNGRTATTSAAAIYDLAAPVGKPEAPPLTFRRGRIVARGDRLEHWLDGQRVVDVSLDSPEFEAAKALSKFAGVPDFARGAGRIVLQDHGDEVWFRRVFVRDLSSPVGRRVDLDLGPELHGWSRVGDARYTGDGTTIVGEVTGGAQSFLHTDRLFGDFILEVDVKLDVIANSGIQVRSTVDQQAGTLSGYQIEIDPTERRWSGGLYDERRRGWLDDLSEDAAARAAFDREGWNRYRIECVGPWLRAWINGVPTSDHLDGMTLEGVVGLQVHSGPEGRFRWRDLRLRDLGRHRWAPLPLAGPDAAPQPATTEGPGAWLLPLVRDATDVSLRIHYAGDGAFRLGLRHARGAALSALPDTSSRAEPLQPAESGGAGAFWVVPRMGTGPDPAAIEHVLEVHALGDRIAVVQDGVTVADLRGAPTPRSSGAAALSFVEAHVDEGQVLEVRRIERLVAVPEDR